MKKQIRTGLLRVALGVALSLSTSAHAGVVTWNNTGTDWNTDGSWSAAYPKSSADSAKFTNAAVTSPNLSGSLTNAQVSFSATTSSGYTLGSSGSSIKLTLTSTGIGSTDISGAAINFANSSGTNTITAPIILGQGAGNTANVRGASGGTLNLSATIAELVAGTRLGFVNGGTFLYSGSNTYSGGTTFDAGILALGSDFALGGGLFTWNGGSLRSSSTASRLITNAVALPTTGTYTLGDTTQTGNLIFSGPVALSGTPLFSIALGSAAAFLNAISETTPTMGVTKGASSGTLFLLGTNSFSGKFTAPSVSGLTVYDNIANSGSDSALGRNGTIGLGGAVAGNAALRYVGGAASTDRIIDFGNGANLSGIGTITLDASGTGPLEWKGSVIMSGSDAYARSIYLDGISTATNTFTNVLANGAAAPTVLEKRGVGTWLLSGANTFTNGIKISSGKLVLDYAATASVANSVNLLTLNGGTLELKGNSAGSTAQTLGNVLLLGSADNAIVLDSNGGSGTTLTMGSSWTRNTGSSSSLLIDLSSPNTALSSALSLPGLGVWGCAVVKDATSIGLAAKSGGNVVRLTTYTALTANNTLSASVNYSLANTITRTAGGSPGSLSVDTTGGGSLNLGGNTVTLSDGSWKPLVFAGSGDYAISNGTLAYGNANLDLHQYSTGLVTISATLGGGSAAIFKHGPGMVVLGNKGGSGALRITGGAVRAAHANVIAGALSLCNGGTLELTSITGDFTESLGTAVGTVQFFGDGGFSAFGGTRTVQIGNNTNTILWGAANFVPANNALALSTSFSDSMIDFQNGLEFGNLQRVVDVRNGSASTDARLSGVLSGGFGGGLIKRGAGTLELTGANSYAGDTWVEQGTAKVSSSAGTGLVTVFSGAAVSGTGTVNRLTLKSGAKLAVYDTGAGVPSKLKVSGALNIANGTLDLSGLGTLAAGNQVIVEAGSIIGSQFDSVVGLPAQRTVAVTPTGIVLKPVATGTVIIIR